MSDTQVDVFEGVETVMVSQPLHGKTEEEITASRMRAAKFCTMFSIPGFNFVNTEVTDGWYDPVNMQARGVVNVPLCYFAKSVESMSKCQLAYFSYGWELARGCRLEHAVAEAYGLVIVEEKSPAGFPLHISRPGPANNPTNRRWYELTEDHAHAHQPKATSRRTCEPES